MFGQLLRVIESRGTDTYDEEVAKLPEGFQHSYHELLKWHAQFVVTWFGCRRGREGIAELPKDAYRKKSSDVTGMSYYQKFVSESSKNHQADKEDDAGGVIPFFESADCDWNPGMMSLKQLLACYLRHSRQVYKSSI